MLSNKTKNQHYISRVEQKLNASNPYAKSENQRIFSFEVKDRESFSVKLENNRGRKISNNLSEQDLFSFDAGSSSVERFNFEDLFGLYEAKAKSLIESLLLKINNNKADITNEIIEIFYLKIVNLIRNPFSIQKVMNSFSTLKSLVPVEKKQREMFERVLNGEKNHAENLCQRLNMSRELYGDWLGIIFLMLTQFRKNEPNIVEEVVNGLFTDKNTYVDIQLFYYTSESCILSDRSCLIIEPTPDSVTWAFNLSSNLFAQYSFISIDSLLANKKYDLSIVERYKDSPKNIRANLYRDNLEELKLFNQRTMYQCYKCVYCSKEKPWGLHVL